MVSFSGHGLGLVVWSDWQSYAAPVIVLLTLLVFIWRWKKASDAKCCGGRCGCSVSKRRKKAAGDKSYPA